MPGVAGVHDLHLWSIAGDDMSLTAHVVVADNAAAPSTRSAVTAMLHDRYEIDHSTLQMETGQDKCPDPPHA